MLKSTKKISLLKCLSLQKLLSMLKSQSLKFSKICKSKTSKHSKMSKSTKSSKFIKMSKCNDLVRQFFFDVLWTDVYSYQVSKESSHRFWKRTFLQVFTIYGHGSHTGYVTKLICIYFHSFQFI